MKTNYVVGLAFNSMADHVLLIKKLRPEWQKGLLNGIGGKIEKGEAPLEAMHRESAEEAGLILDWIHKGRMFGTEFDCHIFYAYSDDIFKYKQLEMEVLGVFGTENHEFLLMVDNLHFLIPFGMLKADKPFMTLIY